jgi:two-component system, OmpR family, phosphate regulon response regulator PhoB
MRCPRPTGDGSPFLDHVPLGLYLGYPQATVVLGDLGLFGVVFALNSSVHSYLVLAYSHADKVALDVGFYLSAAPTDGAVAGRDASISLRGVHRNDTRPRYRMRPMPRILVIEDEPGLQQVLDYNLRREGHEVLLAPSGAEGLRVAREARPDLVLLDWMLPDRSGTEVCRQLKGTPTTSGIPVIFVTARSDEVDRIVGFEVGAADYIVKPFSIRELVLRVQAVLRRNRDGAAPVRTVAFGCLSIDEDAHRIWVDEQEIELTLLEWKLLLALYENRDRVQTRGALLDGVWGMDVSITTRTVDTHVKRLRDKLQRAGEYIETVRGIGYRFAAAPPLTSDTSEVR